MLTFWSVRGLSSMLLKRNYQQGFRLEGSGLAERVTTEWPGKETRLIRIKPSLGSKPLPPILAFFPPSATPTDSLNER